MNIGTLEIALKKFIEKNTKHLMFPQQEDENERAIKVFSGFLPPNTLADEIPAIVIRFKKGDDNTETRFFNFDLYFAIYDKDPVKGYKGLVLLIERVINRIAEEKYIGDYFVFEDIAEFEIEDEQPYPFWIGNARVKFSAPKPSYVGHREGGYFG